MQLSSLARGWLPLAGRQNSAGMLTGEASPPLTWTQGKFRTLCQELCQRPLAKAQQVGLCISSHHPSASSPQHQSWRVATAGVFHLCSPSCGLPALPLHSRSKVVFTVFRPGLFFVLNHIKEYCILWLKTESHAVCEMIENICIGLYPWFLAQKS